MLYLKYRIDDQTTEDRMLPVHKVFDFGRTRFCQYLIGYNTEKGKFLAIDGRIQSTESEFMEYHKELLFHIPKVTEEKKALVLGSGEGVTGSLLSEKGYMVDQVDCDGVLIRSIEKHLRDWIAPIKTPNTITTYIYDAYDWLNHAIENELEYDVVVFDLTEPNVASEDCYSIDIIEKINKVLKPSGHFAFQDGSIYDPEPIMSGLVADANIKEILKVKETFISESKKAEWQFQTIIKGE